MKLFFGNTNFTSVPISFSDAISNPIHNLSHSFLHKYNPIPVDFFSCLPLVPVNPFSKTLPISALSIPLSLIYSITFSFLFSADNFISLACRKSPFGLFRV